MITGAASGMGEAMAILFAKEGASVLACDINEEALEKVVQGIKDSGGKVALSAFDVTDEDKCREAVEMAVERFGSLDILVTNPWWHPFKTVLDISTEEWKKTLDVTLNGVFYCCKYALRAMLEGGKGGSIINNSSVQGSSAAFSASSYMTAKGGVNQLTKSIAMDYGVHKIRANTISPGGIDTQATVLIAELLKDRPPTPGSFNPMLKRAGKPEEVAYAALFLASDEASYITGIDLLVDGGLSGRVS